MGWPRITHGKPTMTGTIFLVVVVPAVAAAAISALLFQVRSTVVSTVVCMRETGSRARTDKSASVYVSFAMHACSRSHYKVLPQSRVVYMMRPGATRE